MSRRTIRAEDIPADLKARQFLQSLDLTREELVFEDNGEARVLLLSAKTLEQQRKAREQLFALIDRMMTFVKDYWRLIVVLPLALVAAFLAILADKRQQYEWSLDGPCLRVVHEYHTTGYCPLVAGNSTTELTRRMALAQGLTPCKRCQPGPYWTWTLDDIGRTGMLAFVFTFLFALGFVATEIILRLLFGFFRRMESTTASR